MEGKVQESCVTASNQTHFCFQRIHPPPPHLWNERWSLLCGKKHRDGKNVRFSHFQGVHPAEHLGGGALQARRCNRGRGSDILIAV